MFSLLQDSINGYKEETLVARKNSKLREKNDSGKRKCVQRVVSAKEQLSNVVKETVEEVLNKILYKETDKLCEGQNYEHTAKKKNTNVGHYKRSQNTSSDMVNLKVPKLTEAAKIFEKEIGDTLTYMKYSREHWRSLWTNNSLTESKTATKQFVFTKPELCFFYRRIFSFKESNSFLFI